LKKQSIFDGLDKDILERLPFYTFELTIRS
jgi:hypothetical protein